MEYQIELLPLALQLLAEVGQHLWELVVHPLGEARWRELGEQVWRQVTSYLENCICPELWAQRCALFEFYRTVSNLYSDTEQWEIFESLVSNCGWIFAFERVCVVCDRPIKLNFNSEQRLHALGEPAIQFADGYSLYCDRGIPIPEKYGSKSPDEWQPEWYLAEHNTRLRRILIEVIPQQKLQPEWYLTEPDFQVRRTLIEVLPPQKLQPEWYLTEPNFQLKRTLIEVLPTEKLQPEWLLSERNAELRRQLIRRIGYVRICQELQATELDKYLEYTLLKIDADIDREPIYLLKMTCPSTGAIHALRSPPTMQSAREAIRWVNWDIEPEEFSVQT